MNRIPQSFIDDLLSRLDIVDIIDHRVKLKKSGKNYSACCPFHEEKTPSFTVSQEKQFYYCFGCGATGSALTFLLEYERLGFIDAVESLAKTAGVEVPKETSDRSHDQNNKRKKLYEYLNKAAGFYQEQLKSHPKKELPIRYLQERGLTGQAAKNFLLGYAPEGWDNLLNELGTSSENQQLLIDSGLLIVKEDGRQYDRFRQRIMYPIRDVRGRVIGFGGRVLGNDKPKYLNSPETDVFHKSRELYGLYEARQANRQLDNLLVVEGYMDVIALAQYDITQAVATLGTACGEEHLQLAFRYTNHVIFCFDGDNAGRSAAKRALLNSLPSMQDGRQIRFLFLAEGQDPDTLVRQIGKERFIAELENAQPLEEFLFDVAAEELDISTMEGRASFSKAAAPLINLLPESVFRELMFGSLASRTGLSAEILRELTKEPVKFIEPSPVKPFNFNEAKKSFKQAPNQIEVSDADGEAIVSPHHTADQYPSEQYQHEHNQHEHNQHEHNQTNIEAPSFEDEAPSFEDIDAYYKNQPQQNNHENLEQFIYQEALQKTHQGTPQNSEQEFQTALQQHIQKPSTPWKTSKLVTTPEKAAIILLLKDPNLLKQLEYIPPIFTELDTELSQDGLLLKELVGYLKQRPEATFNKILGYWAGTKSIEAQQSLRKLVDSSDLKSAKKLDHYNALDELKHAFTRIEGFTKRNECINELHLLKQKGLSNLSDTEKNRYRELVSQNKF